MLHVLTRPALIYTAAAAAQASLSNGGEGRKCASKKQRLACPPDTENIDQKLYSQVADTMDANQKLVG